eukprot:SAG31_NODE_10168_length_1175_cov_2.695167_2_plen_157_part_00
MEETAATQVEAKKDVEDVARREKSGPSVRRSVPFERGTLTGEKRGAHVGPLCLCIHLVPKCNNTYMHVCFTRVKYSDIWSLGTQQYHKTVLTTHSIMTQYYQNCRNCLNSQNSWNCHNYSSKMQLKYHTYFSDKYMRLNSIPVSILHFGVILKNVI